MGTDVAGVRLGVVRVVPTDARAALPSLFEEINSVIELAEQSAHDAIRHGRFGAAETVSERISANLLDARTYVESGMPAVPQVANGIGSAAAAASDLADSDSDFGPLLSALRRLRESANRAAKGYRF